MRFEVVGSSPAWPNPGGAHSGYLVHGDGRLLLDCGPGVLPRLRAAADGGWPRVDAIAITHFHLDHWGDLVPWVWGTMFRFGREAPPVDLWLPPNGRDDLGALGPRLGKAGMFDDCFRLHEYVEGKPFLAAGVEVTALRVPHYDLDAYGFRVAGAGVTIGYSGDSGPSERLEAIARDADLFVCEATLERGDLDGDLRGHLSADEALAAYERSGAGRLLLTHRPAELAGPDGVEVASDGLVLEL